MKVNADQIEGKDFYIHVKMQCLLDISSISMSFMLLHLSAKS